MEIQITNRNLEMKTGQKDYIERRLQFALGRFVSEIRSVGVTLTDINGPRGGEDVQCALQVRLRKRGQIVASDTDVSVEAAVANAVDRVARSVARSLDRRSNHQSSSMSGLSGR